MSAPTFDEVFVPARKARGRARVLIFGGPGSGKTWTALAVAEGLAPDGLVALLDSEHGSAAKYASRFEFVTASPEDLRPPPGPRVKGKAPPPRIPNDPRAYIAAIEMCSAAGVDVLVIDSISHAWSALLELVDQAAAQSYGGNTQAAWSWATPVWRELLEAILRARCHVIVCARAATEYQPTKNDKGKVVFEAVAVKPEARKGLDYEFDIVLEMQHTTVDGDLDHFGKVTKTRCSDLDRWWGRRPGRELGERIGRWLDGEPGERDRMLAELEQLQTEREPDAWAALLKPCGVTPAEVLDLSTVRLRRLVLAVRDIVGDQDEDAPAVAAG